MLSWDCPFKSFLATDRIVLEIFSQNRGAAKCRQPYDLRVYWRVMRINVTTCTENIDSRFRRLRAYFLTITKRKLSSHILAYEYYHKIHEFQLLTVDA